MHRLFLYILFAVTVFSSQEASEEGPTGHQNNELEEGIARASLPENIRMQKTMIEKLKTGDVVTRLGNDIISEMISQLNRNDRSFSHCGLVVVEDGYPMVYHSIGGEDNPDERLRRDSVQIFWSGKTNFAIGAFRYRLDERTISRLTDSVHACFERRPLFDMQFNLEDDDKMYCAEFIAKMFNRATDSADYISTSTLAGKAYYPIESVFNNLHTYEIGRYTYK